MRNIIIHYHIFKNAGSTIDAILKNNFGARCGSTEGPNPWDTLCADDILKYALSNPDMVAISSHQARLPLPKSRDLAFHPILFLRHPLDRAGSVYAFERRQPINSPGLGIKVAHEKDFAGYVKWRLSDGNGAVIKNFQTVFLSGQQNDMRVATATDTDLRAALDTVSQLPFFGVVEHFDDSLIRMKNYLSHYFQNININYSIANKSIERKNTLQQRLEDMKLKLGSDLYQELLDKNELDIQLYNHTVSIFLSEKNA